MKSLNLVLFISVCLLKTSIVEAAYITYQFSGAGSSMFEHDGATDVNTTVSNSSMFGFDLSDDVVFNAQFTYDTTATESSYRTNYPENNAAVFSSGLVSYDVTVGSLSYSFNTLGSIQIWDDRSGKDSFSISASENFNSDTFIGSGFYIFDYTNSSQEGFLIPDNLEKIHANGTESFKFYWLDRNNGDQLHFSGNVSSLTAVPLPASLWFMISGFALLLKLSSRANKALVRDAGEKLPVHHS